jgi:hypothetical protein
MSVTTWTRIEPDILTGDPQKDLALGIAAEIADPLWLLGRQWQMGEWQGENGGSPVSASVSASSYVIDSLGIGSGVIPYLPASTPVDTLVEQDGGSADVTMRATGGRALLDAMAEHKVSAYQSAAKSVFGFTAQDGASVLETVLIAASGVDGVKALAAANAVKIAQALNVAADDIKNFNDAIQEWTAWYAPRVTAAVSPAWQMDRLEYQFSMGATVKEGRVNLSAPEHHGDRIDWDTFTAAPFVAVPAGGPAAQPVITRLTMMPALLQIPGMPSPWFWEVEDPATDAARIEAGPSDTARLLLIEAALAFAPDWFLLSLRLPVASLSKIDSLQVTDTFGITTMIGAAEAVRPDANWSLWKVTQGAGRLGYLLLPPPNISFLTSEPVEEVAMVRDEAANLAWALHRIPTAPAQAATVASGDGDLVYVPIAPLPDERVPMMLTESADGRFLVEGQLVNRPANVATELLPAGLRVRDEEVPDEGLTLRRRFELGRTPDGLLRLWVSRETKPGARLPSSGLRFDGLDAGDKATQTP